MKLFERYATGNHSGREVARLAITDGLVFRKSLAPVPQATLYKILRNRLYTGDFDWNGKTYRGVHVPIVTKDLWDRVQAILDQRFEKRHRKSRHQFAFSGLISCGHCGREVAPLRRHVSNSLYGTPQGSHHPIHELEWADVRQMTLSSNPTRLQPV